MTGDDDGGFTLIEVLLAIVIAAIVFSVVSASFIIALRSTGESTDRLLESQGSAFTSASFAKDVQRATGLSLLGRCSGATGTPVVSLSGQEVLASGTTDYTADYRYDRAAGTLTRFTCGSSTSSSVVAGQLASVPIVVCEGAASGGSRPVVSDCTTPSTRVITLRLVDRVDITASRRLR